MGKKSKKKPTASQSFWMQWDSTPIHQQSDRPRKVQNTQGLAPKR